jgi:hemolysin activation/secretion protein
MEESRISKIRGEKTLRKKEMFKMRKISFLCATLMIFNSFTNAVGANLPAAVTPGGAMPKFQQQITPIESLPVVVIPPVSERPLNAEEGVKIVVNRFELEGVIERPGLINANEVEGLVEELRKKRAGLMTMGQMQLVVDEVTNYYRSHGLILAKAYIPAQTVIGDAVKLTVLEGKLGAVVTEGVSPLPSSIKTKDFFSTDKSRYSKKLLQKPFQPLLGEPVVKDQFEEALFQLLHYPGLKYTAVVRPGSVVGTADLYIKETEERLINGSLSLDNYGSKYTGEYRPRLDISFNNPTKAADKLNVTLMGTVIPSNDLYGGASYERPLPWSNNYLGVDYARNAFDVGGSLDDLQLSGRSDIFGMYYKHSFQKSRVGSINGLLRFSSITALTTQESSTLNKDKLSVLSAETEFVNYIDQWFGGGVTNMNIVVSRGLRNFLGSNDTNDLDISRVTASGEKAPAEFWKFNAEYSRLQRLWTNASLLFRFSGQATDSALVSVEQFTLGGPNTVRAYPQAELMMDQGYFTSAELIFNAPGFANRPAFSNRTWGELLQVSLFCDNAGGELKDPLSNEEESGYLSGAGVGVHFTMPGVFSADLSIAVPIGARHNADSDRDYYTYFAISYQF